MFSDARSMASIGLSTLALGLWVMSLMGEEALRFTLITLFLLLGAAFAGTIMTLIALGVADIAGRIKLLSYVVSQPLTAVAIGGMGFLLLVSSVVVSSFVRTTETSGHHFPNLGLLLAGIFVADVGILLYPDAAEPDTPAKNGPRTQEEGDRAKEMFRDIIE